MNVGAHDEAVWIEWVEHAPDHAAHDCRRQWMGRQLSFDKRSSGALAVALGIELEDRGML